MGEKTGRSRLGVLRSRLRGHWIEVAIVLSILVYAGLAVYGNVSAVVATFRRYDWVTLVGVVGVTSAALGFRYAKWEYLLRSLDIEVPLHRSAAVFFSGLIMVVAPMKGAGIWRGWLLRQSDSVPIRRVVPVVAAERFSDLLALAGLGALGILLYRRSVLVVLLIVVGLVGVLGVIQSRSMCLTLLEWVEGIPVLGRFAHDLESAYEDAYELFQLRPLSVALGLSLCAWAIEGLSVWFVLHGFDIDSSPLVSVFVFSVGSLVGGVTLLPGGITTTEASIAGLLTAFGFQKTIVASTTILVRLGTLWYGVALGIAVYSVYKVMR